MQIDDFNTIYRIINVRIKILSILFFNSLIMIGELTTCQCEVNRGVDAHVTLWSLIISYMNVYMECIETFLLSFWGI